MKDRKIIVRYVRQKRNMKYSSNEGNITTYLLKDVNLSIKPHDTLKYTKKCF